MTQCAGRSPAPVATASPTGRPCGYSVRRSSRHSASRRGPAARWMAPSTPPPPSRELLAALTIASTSSVVMSPSTASREAPWRSILRTVVPSADYLPRSPRPAKIRDMNLTTKAQEALSAAVRDAVAAGHPHVEPAHILLALTRQTETTTGPLPEAAGSSAAAAAQAATGRLAHTPKVSGSSVSAPGLSRAGLAVLDQAQQAMTSMGDSYV